MALALLTPGSFESHNRRAEQLRSLRLNKRVIPLLAARGADRPSSPGNENYRDFTGTKPYKMALGELIHDCTFDLQSSLCHSSRTVRRMIAPAIYRLFASVSTVQASL